MVVSCVFLLLGFRGILFIAGVQLIIFFLRIFVYVAGLMVEQAEAGSIFPLGMLAHSDRGDS